MNRKLITEKSVNARDIMKEAYESSDLTDIMTFRDYERAAAFPFKSASATMRDKTMPGYYELVYLGIFIPKPTLLIRYFYENRKRLASGDIDREEYRKYQTPIVSLLRRLNLNPLNLKLNKTRWRQLSTTKTQLKRGR